MTLTSWHFPEDTTLRGRFQQTQLPQDAQEAQRRHFLAIQALCLEPPGLVRRAATTAQMQTAQTAQMQRIGAQPAMSSELHVSIILHCIHGPARS